MKKGSLSYAILYYILNGPVLLYTFGWGNGFAHPNPNYTLFVSNNSKKKSFAVLKYIVNYKYFVI